MLSKYILAIETSCDETSVSIIKNGYQEIATVVLSQMDIHADYGGVVPEIASRNHIQNITLVIEEVLTKANMTIEEIDAIAVTYGPGLIGSLLIGLMAAKTLSFIYCKPLVPVHHIAGHIYANNLVKPMEFPLIALVVSGGHTDLIYMKEDYNFKRIGGTLDDAVGEAYDKVARVMGLSYPGGPEIDNLAKIGEDTYSLPTPLDDDSYNFSFSGLKSAVINLIHNEEQRGNIINVPNLATSFQNRVINILTKKTMRALEEYQVKNLIVAGGVAANSGLRTKLTELCLEKHINLTIPSIKYCTDNAAMIGAAGYYAYKLDRIDNLDVNAKAVTELQ
ncbi:MAG: tRNA (adenosine(37)-N6)-threonylcarbamoyltransferase complex transferase subunit TsaD [Bacilli bacterium]|nr:tRNA (adenosine(37)-N6)-threonylcarbamoyltransferase complex transferase subunit TsaD [Bacilli bacterium]MDD4809510.1 tRNA (adenosine(37)-N6)-threonylcarbamoyltransferase complex transferase subunit TsaD [Bacilli bacterium]